MKKTTFFFLSALSVLSAFGAPSVSYNVATNIACRAVTNNVAPWALMGQPKPAGGGGSSIETNDVKAIIENEVGGTNTLAHTGTDGKVTDLETDPSATGKAFSAITNSVQSGYLCTVEAAARMTNDESIVRYESNLTSGKRISVGNGDEKVEINYRGFSRKVQTGQTSFDVFTYILPLLGGTLLTDAYANNLFVSKSGDTVSGDYVIEEDDDGNGSLSVGTRKSGSVKGSESFTVGSGSEASGNQSVAFFGGSAKSGSSIAIGAAAVADGSGSIAIGPFAKTFIGNDYHDWVFVWNHQAIDFPFVYTSHGYGTFNINPFGGAEGFYIGEKKFSQYLSEATPSDYAQVKTAALGAAPQATTYTKTEVDAKVEYVDLASNIVWKLEADGARFFFKPVRPVHTED